MGKQSTALCSALATAAATRMNGGTFRLYSGATKGAQNENGTVASLTGTLVATWTAQNPAFAVASGVATLSGTPLSATCVATAALSAANANGGYLVAINSSNQIEYIISASLSGGGGEIIFDSQPQSGGQANITSATRTFPAGT